jgi:ketosteroid isomerase-like protein
VSTHPNAALMRAGSDAYTTGDLESLSDHVGDDFAFHFPGRSPLAGVAQEQRRSSTLWWRDTQRLMAPAPWVGPEMFDDSHRRG